MSSYADKLFKRAERLEYKYNKAKENNSADYQAIGILAARTYVNCACTAAVSYSPHTCEAYTRAAEIYEDLGKYTTACDYYHSAAHATNDDQLSAKLITRMIKINNNLGYYRIASAISIFNRADMIKAAEGLLDANKDILTADEIAALKASIDRKN